MTLNFSPKTIVKSLFIIALLLISFHTVSLILVSQSANQLTEVLEEKFSMEREGNFPSYFSAFILFLAAVQFSIISRGTRLLKNSSWRYWSGLSFIFVFLSLDEAVQLHEKLDTDLIWASVETSGLLAWPWVILYGSIATVIAVIYFRFWLRFVLKFRIAYALAAAVYVFSALGFEMLEALEYTTNGGDTLKYTLLTSAEEIFEMAAILFLINTNFTYTLVNLPDLSISFGPVSHLETS